MKRNQAADMLCFVIQATPRVVSVPPGVSDALRRSRRSAVHPDARSASGRLTFLLMFSTFRGLGECLKVKGVIPSFCQELVSNCCAKATCP